MTVILVCVTLGGVLIHSQLAKNGQWLVECLTGMSLHLGGLIAQCSEGHHNLVEEFVVGANEVDQWHLLVGLDVERDRIGREIPGITVGQQRSVVLSVKNETVGEFHGQCRRYLIVSSSAFSKSCSCAA